METEVLLAGLATLILLIFAVSKWAINGKFFHPGFIYSVVNCGIFIIFVFGPYTYPFNDIEPLYYLMYVLLIYTFTIGITWGDISGRKMLVKDIRLKPIQSLSIYTLSVIFSLLTTGLLILESGGSFQGAVENRFEQIQYEADISNSNPILFIFQNIELSFCFLSTAMLTSYCVWQRNHYRRIVVLFLLVILRGLFANSRGNLVFGLVTIFVPLYIIFKERKLFSGSKIKWFKKIKFLLPALVLIIAMIVILTNLRSSARIGDLEISYKLVEKVYKAESKPWFEQLANTLPNSLVNPIAQLSLYAGGTVFFGGVVTDIVLESGLMTWGARTLNPLHRILDRLKLDGGLASLADQNTRDIIEMGNRALSYSWWGDPANFIVDFGLIGAPLVSLTIGWVIGWMYGRIYNSGHILKATGTAIILNSVLLTPAVSPFGYFPGFISLSVIGFYLINKSFKKSAHRQSISKTI